MCALARPRRPRRAAVLRGIEESLPQCIGVGMKPRDMSVWARRTERSHGRGFHEVLNVSRRKKKPGKKKRHTQKHYSGLEHHKRLGKVLTPPMLSIPGLRPSSWLDDRLPELLWSALLVTHLPRELALEIFRRVAKVLEGRFEPNKPLDIGHTGLMDMPADLARSVVRLVCSAPGSREVLRPLLLLDKLPLLEIWAEEIRLEPEVEDWEVLRFAVAHVFDHLTRLRRVTRVGGRENGLELFVGYRSQGNRGTGKSSQLRKHGQIGWLPVRDINGLGTVRGGDRDAKTPRERERQKARARLVVGFEDLTHINCARQLVHPARKPGNHSSAGNLGL